MELISTAWDAIVALIIFALGFALANALRSVFGGSSRRVLLLYVWHTIFCFVFVDYVLQYGGDAIGYFHTAKHGGRPFSFGTAAVTVFTTLLASGLGLSLLGTSLVYNILGFIGLMAFDSSLRVATANKSPALQRFAFIIILLPSISYWSAGIGKDALTFMATGLTLWAMIDLKRRTGLLVFAVVVMLLVRPHMAGLIVIALAASLVVQRRVSLGLRLMLGMFTFAAAAIVVPFAMDFAGLGRDASSTDVVSYIEQRQMYNQEGGSGIDISSMSLPMQLFTYLFRPLPFEATSIFALISSLDNLILLFLFAAGAVSMLLRRQTDLVGNRAFMWFYCFLAWIILAMTTANMGISLRQKWMFAPILIFLLISLIGKTRQVPAPRASPIVHARPFVPGGRLAKRARPTFAGSRPTQP